MHRILIPIDSLSEEAWEYAFAYATKINESAGKSLNVMLLTHTKPQLTQGGFRHQMGASAVRALAAGKPVQLPSGSTLRHATLRTVGRVLNDAILIAYYAETKMLEAVDDLKGLAGVIVVPDFPESADQWAARWSPIVHGKTQQTSVSLIDDPVVEAALLHLTQMVNLSTGLAHPRDKDMANEVLRILRYKNHNIDVVKMKSWAIKNGWQSDGANDLARLASKIGSLRRKPSMAKIYNWQDRYSRWNGAN